MCSAARSLLDAPVLGSRLTTVPSGAVRSLARLSAFAVGGGSVQRPVSCDPAPSLAHGFLCAAAPLRLSAIAHRFRFRVLSALSAPHTLASAALGSLP